MYVCMYVCVCVGHHIDTVYTFLYGRGLQHLLVVGVVESTLGPEGDLPLHLLAGKTVLFFC